MGFIPLNDLRGQETYSEDMRIACILSAMKESWDKFEEQGLLSESDADYIVCSDVQGILEQEFGFIVSDKEALTCLSVMLDMNEYDKNS